MKTEYVIFDMAFQQIFKDPPLSLSIYEAGAKKHKIGYPYPFYESF